ncbi:hypothetical protein ACX3YG_06355 [Pseudomonas wadenswilerensis]
MDIKTLTRLWGIDGHSVVEHKQLEGADYLVIDLKHEPTLARQFKAGTTGLPDGDVFQTDYLVNGEKRTFAPDHVEKYRELRWADADNGEEIVPGWVFRIRSYPPNSVYGSVRDFLGFLSFDFQDGTYDLSTEATSPFARPGILYSLGYLMEGEHLRTISAFVAAGETEVHHVPVSEDQMRLSAAFSNVVFHMPNCREYLPQAPDHPFDIELPIGFYEFVGDV